MLLLLLLLHMLACLLERLDARWATRRTPYSWEGPSWEGTEYTLSKGNYVWSNDDGGTRTVLGRVQARHGTRPNVPVPAVVAFFRVEEVGTSIHGFSCPPPLRYYYYYCTLHYAVRR